MPPAPRYLKEGMDVGVLLWNGKVGAAGGALGADECRRAAAARAVERRSPTVGWRGWQAGLELAVAVCSMVIINPHCRLSRVDDVATPSLPPRPPAGHQR